MPCIPRMSKRHPCFSDTVLSSPKLLTLLITKPLDSKLYRIPFKVEDICSGD